MAMRVIKQPNGKYALFSTVVDHLLVYDATEDEIRVELRAIMMEEVERTIDGKIRAACEDWPPHTRGKPGTGRDRWNADAYTMLAVHPDDPEVVNILLSAGMTPSEIAGWQRDLSESDDDD